MHRHSFKILFIAKLTSGLVIPSLIAAGLARVQVKRWFPGLFSAEILWTGTLVLVGYYATQAVSQVEKGFQYLGVVGTLALVLVFLEWLRRSYRRGVKAEAAEDPMINNE
jgi:membrane protein DedA with SNARE-associated domain